MSLGILPVDWMDGMEKISRSLGSQFINDMDPYSGSSTRPAQLAVEVSSDDGWEDFQDTNPSLHPDFMDTQPEGFPLSSLG